MSALRASTSSSEGERSPLLTPIALEEGQRSSRSQRGYVYDEETDEAGEEERKDLEAGSQGRAIRNSALASSSTGIPFPTQPDPSRPLRPSAYKRLSVSSQGSVSSAATRRRRSGVRSAEEKLGGWAKKNEGLIFIGLAQLFYSTMALFFKMLNEVPPGKDRQSVSALEVICIRMGITWLGCVSWMLIRGTPNPFLGPPGVRRLLVLRGAVGFFGLFGLYYSLQFLSLADATVITFLAPLGTGILGWFFLGETFTRREALAGLFSLGGVMLIARPKFLFGHLADADLEVPVGEEAIAFGRARAWSALTSSSSLVSPSLSGSLTLAPTQVGATAVATAKVLAHILSEATTTTTASIGGQVGAYNWTSPAPHDGGEEPVGVTEAQRIVAVCVALLGCLGAAGAYTSIRAIGTRASATHSVAYFSLMSTVVAATAMFVTGQEWVLPAGALWCALLVAIGVFGLAAQILAAMGLQREKAGRATVMVYTQAIYSSVFQFFVLGVSMELLSLLGCLIIVSAAAFTALSK